VSENFVGFASSPKQPAGSALLQEQLALSSELDPAKIFQLFTTEAGLGSWLGQIEKYDLRQGGRIKFIASDRLLGASFTSISIPRQIVLVCENLGELDFQFKVSKSSTEVLLRVSRSALPDDRESWKLELTATWDRFAAASNV